MADFKLGAFQGGTFQPIEGADAGLLPSLKLGTTVSNTELSKTILDNLVSLQDGSDIGSGLHTHDGLYYRETELFSDTSGSSGATLVKGDNKAYTNISGLTSYTIQDFLERIDAALSSAGLTDFTDDLFRISDDGDNSKKIAFQASGIATSTTRTITMPDTDVDLGDIATNSAHAAGDGSDHQDVVDLVTLTGMPANSVDFGSFSGSVLTDNSVLKALLQELETYAENTRSLVQTMEWQDSALSYITDNTAVPPTEVSGDRYILSHDGGAPNAAWDGASAGDIVEFNGTTWDATTPTTGTFISADDEGDRLYQWGGSSWAAKYFEATTASGGLQKVGFDISLAASAAGNGIQLNAGVLSLDFTEFSSDDMTEGATNLYYTAARAALKQDASANLDEADTFFGLTDITGSEAETLTDGSNADSLHEHSKLFETFTNNTGGALSAGQIVALSKSAAGEIIVADASAIATCNAVAGVVAESISNGASGRVQIAGKVTPNQDAAYTLGEQVFVSETAGSSTATAPSASGTVLYRLGDAISTTEILLRPALLQVN